MQFMQLVVTADDFGISLPVSRGIVRAHKQGPVTATSMMVLSGDAVLRSVPLLRDCPKLDVGLHLVLTHAGDRPILARESSGLIDRNDQFFSPARLLWRACTGKISRIAVADEITAQAARFHELLGRPPSHVDAHHHVHQFPVIREALVDVISHGLLPPVTRLTTQPAFMNFQSGAWSKRQLANLLARQMRRVIGKKWVWTNDYFLGMLSRGDLKQPFPWQKYLKHLPAQGVVEWCVHPGEADESLHMRDSYVLQRKVELDALVDPQNAGIWQSLSTSLTRKSELTGRP